MNPPIPFPTRADTHDADKKLEDACPRQSRREPAFWWVLNFPDGWRI